MQNKLNPSSLQDPLSVMQQYVRTMNNQLFLSEIQLNGLYALLLINRPSPWQHILPSNDNMKEMIDEVLKTKIGEVEDVLANLLKIYEAKIRNSNLTWLEKLMSILKAQTKNIYIHKVLHECDRQVSQEQPKFDNEILGIFYGISNINAFTAMGLGKFIEYNASQRFITFKMGKKYNITIQNQDKLFLDTTSKLSILPKEVFTHHIFSYFNATQLFGLRAVCKQWGDYVKQSWHSTFKREMLTQLLASEFCKQIELNYKILQLRNPFYQKLSLLLHALIQIINWEMIRQGTQNNTINLPLKRVLIVLLKLLGDKIDINHINDITQNIWNSNKQKILNIKNSVANYFANLGNTVLNINQIKMIKKTFLDNPFMRVEEMNAEDKTPLLLVIFLKQFALQSIIKNHILLTQQYLLNAKKRLDELSRQWPQNKGFLEGAYKILLLKHNKIDLSEQKEGQHTTPDFSSLLKSIFEKSENEFEKPDFIIKNRGLTTNVFLDRNTKLDIIITTFKQSGHRFEETNEETEIKNIAEKLTFQKNQTNQQISQNKQEQLKRITQQKKLINQQIPPQNKQEQLKKQTITNQSNINQQKKDEKLQ